MADNIKIRQDSSGTTIATDEVGGVHYQYVKLVNGTDGSTTALKTVSDSLRVCNQTYLQALAEGDIAGHTPWTKIGYNGALVASTEADLWSATGVYAFPTAETAMEVDSSSDADVGTLIKGDSTGDTVTSDSGGTATTLVDADVDFGAATAVEVGDCVLLDPIGASPEWGYVTGVDTHTLTVAGGFSSGGSGASRKYAVVDKNTAGKTGAQVVKIEYLDDTYTTYTTLVALAGTTDTARAKTDTFRINSFRVIAAGSGAKAAGNISLRATGDTPIYSYISAGFTRARNAQYTVPTGKTVYVTEFCVGYGYSTNQTHYCRIYTRANIDPATGFNLGSVFMPFTEVVCANTSQLVTLDVPTKLPAKTDIRVSAIASYAGIATVSLRGWIE
jgi:hypothetical protein